MVKDIEVIEPSVKILFPETREQGLTMVKLIERAGRTSYKSEDKITDSSCEKFIKMIVKRGHLSVLEHGFATVRWIGSRTMSHQLVRHRLMAITQESQRFCNYGNGKLKIVLPRVSDTYRQLMLTNIEESYVLYNRMVEDNYPPENARFILPNATKTELVTTANFREWRHIFNLRCDKHAQWEIRMLAIRILNQFQKLIPYVFDDFEIQRGTGRYLVKERRPD